MFINYCSKGDKKVLMCLPCSLLSHLCVTGQRRVNIRTLYTIQVLTHWGRDKMTSCHFADILKRIFIRLPIDISLNIVSYDLFDNRSALVQLMAWHRTGDKPLSEPRRAYCTDAYLLTRPQWVNELLFKTIWVTLHWRLAFLLTFWWNPLSSINNTYSHNLLSYSAIIFKNPHFYRRVLV